MYNYRLKFIYVFIIFGILGNLKGQTLVSSINELNTALASASAGSQIILQNGTWTDVVIDLEIIGTSSAPVIIKAQEKGAVYFEGNSSVHLGGEYLQLEGIIFRNAQNLIDNNNRIEPVIEFRSLDKQECTNCSIKNIKIDSYNGSAAQEEAIFKWVLVYGAYNSISYCSFIGKNGVGSVINHNRNNGEADNTLIHHNYFADRIPVGEFNSLNDQDAIRIGNSSTSLSNSYAKIHSNYFNNWSGEIEIISNKSGSNKYYNNTFRNYQGSLTLRHGDNNEVYGNFFFANNNNTTAGIRVIGENQRIYNNYIEGINSRKEGGSLSGATGGINISNGRPNSALNGYYQVKNTEVVNNTFVNCDYAIRVGTKVSSDLSVPPENLIIANNIMLNSTSSAINETTAPTGLSIYQGNISQNGNWDIATNSNGNIKPVSGLLEDDGLYYRIIDNSPAINANIGTYSYLTTDLIEGQRTLPFDAGAEEFNSSGNKRPYIDQDVGVNVGFIETTQDLNIMTSEQSVTDIIAKNLTIHIGGSLTINEGHTLTVEEDLTVNGSLVIESGGSFINYSNKQNDVITIKRSTRYADGRYSFVGIPVEADPSLLGSHLGSLVYRYDESVIYGDDGLARWINALTSGLQVGAGYAQAFQEEITFHGKPNNGDITVSHLSNTSHDNKFEEHGWNLIANPYPAAISIERFLQENANISGAIYLWDDNDSETGRGSNQDYLTANTLGYVAGPNGGLFNGHIGASQGFFIKVTSPTSNTSVLFKENMRVNGYNSDKNFFRVQKEPLLQVKLALSSEKDALYNELLFVIKSDASIGIDRMYDADKLLSTNDLEFYSIISDNKYAIQAQPFSNEISTALAYDLTISTDLTLTVVSLDNIKEVGTFWLTDKETSASYPLSENLSKSFFANAGENQKRFLLSYRMENELSSTDLITDPQFVYINNELFVNFKSPVDIFSYQLYDLSGRTLMQNSSVHNTNSLRLMISKRGMQILRIETSQGVVTKKLSFN